MALGGNADSVWETEAKKEQIQIGEMLNKMDVVNLDVLKLKLAVCIFGIPEKIKENEIQYELEGLSFDQYDRKSQNVVVKLSQCILQHQRFSDENKIYVSFVLILGRTKATEKKNFQEWIFNVPGREGQNITFIDRNCRVYKGWDDYFTKNTLPKANICYPHNGKYPDEGHNARVYIADTPACNIANDVLFGFDIATSVTTLIGCGLSTAALFVPIAAPFVWTAFAISTVSGLYGAGRSIEHLVDRGVHEQTLSFLDSNARSAWLGATVPFFGIAAGSAAAVAATARVTNMGVQLSEAGKIAINVTNGVNCAAHGVCVASDVYNIIETSINGDEISIVQIFQCIASLLLFANVVASTHQTRLILQSLSSKDNGGRVEHLYRMLQSSEMENGVMVRPTNVLTTSNVISLISRTINWNGLILKVPHLICKWIHIILEYLEKKKEAGFSTLVSDLLPLLKALWKDMQDLIEKHVDQLPTILISSYTNGNCFRSHNVTSEKNRNNVPTSVNSQSESQEESSHKITILDMNWDGPTEPFQKLIQDMLKTENISELDVLQYSQLVYQRLREDLEDKEKHFKMMCKRTPGMTEEELENIIGIEGKRSQYFANEIMKSYRDIKIMALKQDCQRLIKERGIMIPLHSLCGSPLKILYYHSPQKKGTKTEMYLKILQEAKIITHNSSNTYFPSENSFFVELRKDSKYNMAGVLNFAEDEEMMGIIILLEKF